MHNQLFGHRFGLARAGWHDSLHINRQVRTDAVFSHPLSVVVVELSAQIPHFSDRYQPFWQKIGVWEPIVAHHYKPMYQKRTLEPTLYQKVRLLYIWVSEKIKWPHIVKTHQLSYYSTVILIISVQRGLRVILLMRICSRMGNRLIMKFSGHYLIKAQGCSCSVSRLSSSL